MLWNRAPLRDGRDISIFEAGQSSKSVLMMEFFGELNPNSESAQKNIKSEWEKNFYIFYD